MTGSGRSRVAVVGPGAIGTVVAAALSEDGRTPFLAGRRPRPRLRLDTADGTIIVPGPVHTEPDGGAEPADVVFLAVKATQTAAAAPWLRALCAPTTTVCVLQNGLEQVDAVAPLVPESVIVPSVVWFPAARDPAGSVRLLAPPRLSLPAAAGALAVRDVLRGTRCAVEVSDDFRTLAWRKLLQNATAGLMALTGRRSGMFRREDVGSVALAYLEECLAVARADGAELDDETPNRILADFRRAPADRGTSILADRDDGVPLEWDVRNGVVRRRGRSLGLPTPISDIVVPLLAAASDGPG
ncbi:oxidoreductase [Pseudolysinimonas sp.]|uniref:oxidoreductase n=1 Tax=Pseudolysinimonas sp. TaxID=2680009 RepID=UPI003F7F42E0